MVCFCMTHLPLAGNLDSVNKLLRILMLRLRMTGFRNCSGCCYWQGWTQSVAQCVKQQQMVYCGQQSVKTTAMFDEHDHLLSDPAAVTVCWGWHFTKVLNVVSEFSHVGIDRMPLLEIWSDLDAPPMFNKYQGALSKLKFRKSGE